MRLSSLFKIRCSQTPEILELLNATTLGTNGAKYKHLDTSERIQKIDNPIFLSMERNEKVFGNITFCRRNEDWYIRYFAFSSSVQASGKTKNEKGNSLIKKELAQFFEDLFAGSDDFPPIRSLYAYIDPHNARSKWMSENFGFDTVGRLATQTFSRFHPKKSNRFVSDLTWNDISEIAEKYFGNQNYYTNTNYPNDKFCGIRDEKKELIAFARIETVHWEIEQLPGRFGKQLTQLIPYIPFLNKIIQPKNHTFVVPDFVWCKDENPIVLNELFESVLSMESLKLILWWMDETDPFYKNVKSKISWGILDKLVGVSPVDVVQRLNPKNKMKNSNPFFVQGIDMV